MSDARACLIVRLPLTSGADSSADGSRIQDRTRSIQIAPAHCSARGSGFASITPDELREDRLHCRRDGRALRAPGPLLDPPHRPAVNAAGPVKSCSGWCGEDLRWPRPRP